jgi:hypothetical protein
MTKWRTWMTDLVPVAPVSYDRDLLVTVLVYHGRTSIKGCHCGWAKPGASHPEHVADIYEESMRLREVSRD